MGQLWNQRVPVVTMNPPLIHPLEEVLITADPHLAHPLQEVPMGLNPHLTLPLGKVHQGITDHWTGHPQEQEDQYVIAGRQYVTASTMPTSLVVLGRLL